MYTEKKYALNQRSEMVRMLLQMVSSGALCLALLAVTGCDTSNPTGPPAEAAEPTPGAVTVTSVSISGSTTFTSAGQVNQLTATAHLSDGTTRTITDESATWGVIGPVGRDRVERWSCHVSPLRHRGGLGQL